MYKFQSIEQHEKPAVTTAKQEEENRVAPVLAQVETHARTQELSVEKVSKLLSQAKKKNTFGKAIDYLRRTARNGDLIDEKVKQAAQVTGDFVVTNAALDEVLRQREFNS